MLKSTFPSTRPMGGMITSATSELVIFPNAAPMITPTARSTTLPRAMNVLKALSMVTFPFRVFRERAPEWAPQALG